MFRTTALVLAFGLAASTVACSHGDPSADATQKQGQKLSKKDGSPTGNGKTCTLEGIAWGGTGGTTSSVDVGAPAPPPDAVPGGKVDPSGGTGGDTNVSGPAEPPRPVPDGIDAPPPCGAPPPPVVYPVGATFPAPDGCNTCRCDDDGIWCTIQPCGVTGSTGGGEGSGGTTDPGQPVPQPVPAR